MGCPGQASGPSTGTEQIGAVTWGVGYNYPKLVGGGFSNSNYNSAYDGANTANSGLESGTDSCSCLCSGMMAGDIPFFYQFVRTNTYTSHEDTWTSGYFPGGSTGIYSLSTTSRMYYFNIGQSSRCGQIFSGLYQLHGNRGLYRDATGIYAGACGAGSWAGAGRLDVTFHQYLFGSQAGLSGWWKAPSVCGWQYASNEGGFPWISLCINPLLLGTENEDGCPLSSCLNPMDYGTNIPSQSIPNGHNLTPGCPLTSTVWQTCQDGDCSPNGQCLGPPTNPSPTGCISNNSILNGFDVTGQVTGADNGCFDCEGKAVFHPCYGTSLVDPATNTTLFPTWNGAASSWDSPLGAETTAVYGGVGYGVNHQYAGCETMGAGGDKSSPTQYNPNPDVKYHNADFKQSQDWDACCKYSQFGCPDPNFANFNGATTTSSGLDCQGNPDPAHSKYWDNVNSQWMCENVSWVAGGATTFNYNDAQGLPTTATQPSAGSPVPCTSLTSNGAPNMSNHPYAWNKTNYQSADTCCCSDAGCRDDGNGVLSPWTGGGGVPPAVPDPARYTPANPSFSWASAGGNTDIPYYPGYSVMIGLVSPTNITSSAVGASNYCPNCLEDCNGDPHPPGGPGTYNPGWADCCQYQIPGCMDDTPSVGGNPDIFGFGSYLVWNYNPLANVDSGSCFYDEPINGCIDDGGLGLSVVGAIPYPGYVYPGIPANNYDPMANIMDGSCTYDYGCPDVFAVNYDPCADPANYTAISAGGPPMCTSTNTHPNWIAQGPSYINMQIAWVPDLTLCNYDIPGAGPGCMDPQAINYNPLATEDCGGPYGGVLPVPHPQDFTCCTYPTEGCTDPNAWNYNSLAMIDDGSCEYVITPFQDEVNFLNGTPVLLCREPLTKEEALMNVSEPPEIQSEIFIERGKQSVMEPNQRLGEIKTMGGLVNYAYGYYKIKKQE
jgi:hypothetical protein